MAFTYSQLKTDVANRLHNKLGRVLSIRDLLNQGVRTTISFPLKTLRRRYSSPIRLLDDIYDYTAPSDIQGSKVVDLRPIGTNRSNVYAWRNTFHESFDRLKSLGQPVLCVTNNGSSRLLKASFDGTDSKVAISQLDTITDGGTWAAVGTASNLATDNTTYIYGNGSIKFDIGAGTQDGIDVPLDTAVDISDHTSDGSVYVSVSLPSLSGVTGVTVRLGSSASVYTEISVTTDIAGNALTTGFNLLKLDLSDGTETGSPDYENIDYAALLIDKDATTMTGVRFDYLYVGTGSQHVLEYYSRFGWRTSAGVWLEASTADTDILNAEAEEYQLIVEACVEEVANSVREYQDADRAHAKLYGRGSEAGLKEEYLASYPDSSILQTSDIWVAGSVTHQ